MDIEQKYMAELYIKIKEDLDELIGSYMRSNAELKLLKECEGLLAEKLKTAKDKLDEHAWEDIINGVFYQEFEEASKRERDSLKAVSGLAAKQKIDYLELKLEIVKKHLNPETLKIIEKFEIEKLFLKEEKNTREIN